MEFGDKQHLAFLREFDPTVRPQPKLIPATVRGFRNGTYIFREDVEVGADGAGEVAQDYLNRHTDCDQVIIRAKTTARLLGRAGAEA
jgi:hypothetical protein